MTDLVERLREILEHAASLGVGLMNAERGVHPTSPQEAAQWMLDCNESVLQTLRDFERLEAEIGILRGQAELWGELTTAMSVEFAAHPESKPGENAGKCAINLMRRLEAENAALKQDLRDIDDMMTLQKTPEEVELAERLRAGAPEPVGRDWVETVRMAAQEAQLDEALGKPWTVKQMAERLGHPPTLPVGERIEGWAAGDDGLWEFAEESKTFTPGPTSRRATLLLHTEGGE